VEVRGLRLLGRCGALPEEAARPQPLEVDLDVELDLSAAAASDSLADTVDYGAVCAAVEAVITAGHVVLLEHLASLLADAVLALDDRIVGTTVWVRKLRPPVPQDLATSGVRLVRQRAGG
jgi:dihydroneopterin aldolase